MAIKNFEEYLRDVPFYELERELERRSKVKPEKMPNERLNTIAMSIMNKIDDALSKFGKYTFGDKGPDEVMDTLDVYNDIKNLNIDDVGKVLIYIMDNYRNFSSSKGTAEEAISLVNSVIGYFEDHDEFEYLLSMDGRIEY